MCSGIAVMLITRGTSSCIVEQIDFVPTDGRMKITTVRWRTKSSRLNILTTSSVRHGPLLLDVMVSSHLSLTQCLSRTAVDPIDSLCTFTRSDDSANILLLLNHYIYLFSVFVFVYWCVIVDLKLAKVYKTASTFVSCIPHMQLRALTFKDV